MTDPVVIVPAGGRGREGHGLGGPASSWLEQFLTSPTFAAATRTESVRELESASRRIAGRVTPKLVGEGASRGLVVSGAVVGAIQSGKTAVLTGLAAAALDAGVQVVVVLAGTRDDLRRQTARRLARDLLWEGQAVVVGGKVVGYDHPMGAGKHGQLKECWILPSAQDANQDEGFASSARRAMTRGWRLVMAIKKNIASIRETARVVSSVAEMCGATCVSMLVLDDECDEASVSDDPLAATPDMIAELWRGTRVRAAYVGVTATAAANILADTSMPLFPRDFIEVLRQPDDSESSVSYRVSNPDHRYTGGRVFYRWLGDIGAENFLVRTSMTDAEFAGVPGNNVELQEALIAYFVSGAIRLAQWTDPGMRDVAIAPPHTMMAHTESTIDEHWALCLRIVEAIAAGAGGTSGATVASVRARRPEARLDQAALRRWLALDEHRWRAWHERFEGARASLLLASPDRVRKPIPAWDVVREMLPEVFRIAKLRVLNSDPAGVEPDLDFVAARGATGPIPPYDSYSIIVGGNRLSRGLTIEGLCVSYYTRASAHFLEDTTVQRERWFGYRGPHIEYCSLFTHAFLARRLARFHDHDQDLREQLAWNVAHDMRPVDGAVRFLRLADSLPTAKLGRGAVGAIHLSGVRIYFDRVENGLGLEGQRAASANEQLLGRLWERAATEGTPRLSPIDGIALGRVASGLSATEVADILDSWRLSFHNPATTLGARINLARFHRLPDATTQAREGVAPTEDPYLVAAYLRYWDAAYRGSTGDARNSFREVGGLADWSPRPAPRFNLGIRYGSMTPSDGFPFPPTNREVSADGWVDGRWGGHSLSAGYYGDEWFDIDPDGGDRASRRAAGTSGLLLVQVVGRQARGRSGRGVGSEFHRPVFGIVIPLGGPAVDFVVPTRS